MIVYVRGMERLARNHVRCDDARGRGESHTQPYAGRSRDFVIGASSPDKTGVATSSGKPFHLGAADRRRADARFDLRAVGSGKAGGKIRQVDPIGAENSREALEREECGFRDVAIGGALSDAEILLRVGAVAAFVGEFVDP